MVYSNILVPHSFEFLSSPSLSRSLHVFSFIPISDDKLPTFHLVDIFKQLNNTPSVCVNVFLERNHDHLMYVFFSLFFSTLVVVPSLQGPESLCDKILHFPIPSIATPSPGYDVIHNNNDLPTELKLPFSDSSFLGTKVTKAARRPLVSSLYDPLLGSPC